MLNQQSWYFIEISFLGCVLNLPATLDIILSWKAWGSKQYTQILRYLLKFAVATAWIIILSASYSGSIENPTGLIKLFSNWAGNWRNQSLYTYAIIIYMLPNIFSALLFLLPPLRRSVELSNSRVFILLMWWAQASVSYCSEAFCCQCWIHSYSTLYLSPSYM